MYLVHAYTANSHYTTSGPFGTRQIAEQFAVAAIGTPYESLGSPGQHIVRCEIEESNQE